MRSNIFSLLTASVMDGRGRFARPPIRANDPPIAKDKRAMDWAPAPDKWAATIPHLAMEPPDVGHPAYLLMQERWMGHPAHGSILRIDETLDRIGHSKGVAEI